MRNFIWLYPEAGAVAVNVDRIIAVEEPSEDATGCIVTVDGFKNPIWCGISAKELVRDIYNEQIRDADEMPTKVDGYIRIISED